MNIKYFNSRSKGKITRVFIALLIILFSLYVPIQKAEATGIQVYADLTQDVASPHVPSTVTTQPLIADNTSTDIYYSYDATSVFANTDTVIFTFPAGFTIASCTAATTDADNDTTPDGSGSVSSTQYTYTFTAATTDTEVEFCIDTTSPTATASNYSVSMSSTNDSDFGAVMVYAYDDAGPTYQNRINVTALVTPILALTITDTSDTETDDCDLGVLDIVSVNTCAYRLYPGTNQTTGTSTLQIDDISTNAGLTKGAGGDSDDIDNTAANTDVAGGTEGNGIVATETGTSYDLQGNYDDSGSPGDDPVPSSLTTFAQTSSGPIDGTVGGGNYLLVTHRAAADTGTETGAYVQTVQYTVVADP